MMTPQTMLGYVKAEPFRPFRIHLASGRTFDIRHPELLKVLRSNVLVFKTTADTPEVPNEWESVSLMLTQSISHLETRSVDAFMQQNNKPKATFSFVMVRAIEGLNSGGERR